MNIDNFVVLQRRPYKWDFQLQRLRLKGIFSDDLKKVLESTKNISKSPEMISNPKNLKRIFMSDKEKELNVKNFSMDRLKLI